MRQSILAAIAIAAGASVASAADKFSRPNVLLIVADDLCWRDLGCTGNPDVKTPHIDSLARDGLRLNGIYTASPMCSPARHALYTGLYPVRSGAYPNHTKVDAGTRSVFHYLKVQGYDVALHGKEHIRPKSSFPYRYLGNEPAGGVKKAVDFITDHPGKEPWLLVAASNEPHSPWTLGPKFDPETITMPSYLHDNPVTRQLRADYYGEICDLDRQVGELLTALKKSGQLDNTLVLFLSEQGSSFPYGGKWSLYDNGIRVAAFARWPGTIQPGTSCPALMQYVDIAPTLVKLAGGDLTAIDTGCQDADGRTGFDGRDFSGVLFGNTDTMREYVFAQHTTVGVNGYKQPYPVRAVRDARYKLIRNLAPENRFEIAGIHKGEPLDSWKADAKSDEKLADRIEWLYQRPAEELYDIDADEFESNNLANDPKYADVRARLARELDGWMRQQGDKGLKTEMNAPSRQPRATRNKK